MTRIIVAGSRNFEDAEAVFAEINDFIEFWNVNLDKLEIVSGACRGVDVLGEQWANENEVPVKRFPADWKQHGKAAGPIRNREMAKYAAEKHGALIAFLEEGSKGTKSMIELAKEANLLVRVVDI